MQRYQTLGLIGLTLLAFIAASERILAQEEPQEQPPRFHDLMGNPPNYFKYYHDKCLTAELNHERELLNARKQILKDVDAWKQYLNRPRTLDKVVIHIERSVNRFHTISLLTGSPQVPLTIEVSNDYVRHRLADELKKMPRVFYHAPAASKLGAIRLYFSEPPSDSADENVLEIGISDSAFIMGNGVPGLPQTNFYSWTLANFLAESLKEKDAGLSQLSFNILSGADALGNPAKLNIKFASEELREYWSGEADPWYSFPRERRNIFNPAKIFPIPKDKYDVRVRVIPCRYSVGDFEWFRIDGAKSEVDTDLDYRLEAGWGRIEGPRLTRLIQTRIAFAGPIDISECTIMGVISFFAHPDNYLEENIETDVFVTNKGFLWQRDGKYSVFYSYDLANWLNSYLLTHRYDMSQNALNVLSGADAIVAARATRFDINMHEYNLRTARTWYDIPESLRNLSKSNE